MFLISTAKELSSVLTELYFEKRPEAIKANKDYEQLYLVEDCARASALNWAIGDFIFRAGEILDKLTDVDLKEIEAWKPTT